MSSNTIRCIAIDDEPLALDIIEKFCQRIGNVELERYSDPHAGLEAIREHRPDIVFLDIEMDGISGLDIAAQLPEETCFIFTTAYLRYALEGFDLDAVDYLHKPFAFSRFQVAFSKALRRIGRQPIKATSQCIVVKQDYNNISIPIDDIVYIEAVEALFKDIPHVRRVRDVENPAEECDGSAAAGFFRENPQVVYRVEVEASKASTSRKLC